MSRRVVRYEGEGRQRRPVYADEGPSSAAARDPIAMHERLSIPGMGPTGGAGPVERRQITEAERAIRQEARPSPIAPRRSAIVQEEPAVSEAAPIIPETIPVADDALSNLADAVVEAIEARDAKTVADTAWQIAQRGLRAAWRAMPPLDLPDDAPRLREPEGVDTAPPPVVGSPPDHADSIPEPREAEVRHERLLLDPLAAAPVRPSAEGGRATAEQLQASRRNGQAAMQAQRRAAAKATTAVPRPGSPEARVALVEQIRAEQTTTPDAMPPWQRRMVDALVDTGGDRERAATKLGIKVTSLTGSLSAIRKRADLTELERAVVAPTRAQA